MRVLVSGSTGFLGTALVETLEGQNHSIARLVRPGTSEKSVGGVHAQAVAWDPVAGRFDAAGAEGADHGVLRTAVRAQLLRDGVPTDPITVADLLHGIRPDMPPLMLPYIQAAKALPPSRQMTFDDAGTG